MQLPCSLTDLETVSQAPLVADDVVLRASHAAQAVVRKPDFTPFNAVPNRTSLTDGLKTQPSCGPDVPAPSAPAAAAATTAARSAAQQGVEAEWEVWKAKQHLTGADAKPDSANPAQMDHLTWYEAHNWPLPYPDEGVIHAPNDVRGAYLSYAENGG